MAYAMTKQGSLDNCITYEFMCDTVADMNAIEDKYRTIGTVAIVLSGESGMEVYIAGSDKQWNSLSSIGGGAANGDTVGLVIHICTQNEVSNGLPDVELPDETTIYLVPAGNTTGNLYEEYIYVNDTWEKFGTASIDLSNYIQKTDIATQSTAGLVKVLDNGNVTFNENNQLVLTLAGTAIVKTGQSDHPISVTHQHEAAFYGLAKAAGQDMKSSNNAVGTYTTEAASAIRTMIGAGTYSKPAGGISAADLASGVVPDVSGFAPKESPVFTGSISMGRNPNSTIGNNSVAVGGGITASGAWSHAEGGGTTASGSSSHSEGSGTTASGTSSHAEGSATTASSVSAHAEGNMTTASGDIAHAEGLQTVASGNISHAEGIGTIANLTAMHAGGQYNTISPTWIGGTNYKIDDLIVYNSTLYKCKTANSDTTFDSNKWLDQSFLRPIFVIGNGSQDNSRSNAFVIKNCGAIEEGVSTQAINQGAHAEGINTKAIAPGTHAEGSYTQATAQAAHTEGTSTLASNSYAHAEGNGTIASGSYSHAEGWNTTAAGSGAHAEGGGDKYSSKTINNTTYNNSGAHGTYSHSEGYNTWALKDSSHAEGQNSVSLNFASHAEGYQTYAQGSYSHAEGSGGVITKDILGTIYNNYGAYGEASHSEGMCTLATGQNSHTEGAYTIAYGERAHAEGYGSSINITMDNKTYDYSGAYGPYSHVEGNGTLTIGQSSHAEGQSTQATGYYSHAEGYFTKARGQATHAQGLETIATGDYQHVTGTYNIEDNFNYLPEWTANTSYAVGDKIKRTTVENDVTSVQGYICKTANNDATFTSSKWSKNNLMQYAEIVGNGNNSSRSNARALDWNGNEYLMGDVYVGCNADSTGGTKLARIPDPPTTDGVYTLQATVSNGTVTYSWIAGA